MFHIPSLREAMFGDPYLSPCPWDHFAASCRISLKTRTSGYTLNLFFFGTSEFLLATGRMLPGARLIFEVLPSLHKEVIHNHHKKRDQLLDCCVCVAGLQEVGYTNAHSTSWDLYSGVSITQKCYVKQRYISEKYWYSKNARLAIAP